MSRFRPPRPSLIFGESATFTATVTGTSDTSVTRSVSPAGCGTLPTTGKPIPYTAPHTTDTRTITAASTARPSVRATATVAVTAESANTAIIAGHRHSLAADDSGDGWTWGWCGPGTLGNGERSNQLTPVPVAMPTHATFTTLSAWEQHSLALDSDDNAWARGRGDDGRLGNGNTVIQTTPVSAAMPTDSP